MNARLPNLDPPLSPQLPVVPEVGNLKPVEDRIDAVLCAYIGACWWWAGAEGNQLYGSQNGGYIAVPKRSV